MVPMTSIEMLADILKFAKDLQPLLSARLAKLSEVE